MIIYRTMRKFQVLESFRFLAAILVGVGHFFVANKWNGMPVSFILSVDFFFALSAFVITQKEAVGKTSDYINKLFMGRAIRLLIPYMIIVIFYYLFLYRFGYKKNIGFYDFVSQLFLFQILGLNQGNLILNTPGVAWALGLELYIGTIFFSIIHFIKKKYEKALFFCMIMLFVFSLNILNKNSADFMGATYQEAFQIPLGIFRIIVSYSIGTIFAIVYKKIIEMKSKILESVPWFTFFEVCIIFTILKLYGKVNYNRINEYFFPLLAGILILIFSYQKGIISLILIKISRLGKLSYSIYLIHPICIEILKYFNVKNLYFFIGMTILSSFLFYYFVEKKIIDLKYNVVNKK